VTAAALAALRPHSQRTHQRRWSLFPHNFIHHILGGASVDSFSALI
jgi:hypothetical protein